MGARTSKIVLSRAELGYLYSVAYARPTAANPHPVLDLEAAHRVRYSMRCAWCDGHTMVHGDELLPDGIWKHPRECSLRPEGGNLAPSEAEIAEHLTWIAKMGGS